MTAPRIGIAACTMQLVACSGILGLKEIIPDGSPARLSFIAPPPSVAVQEPLDGLVVRVEDVLGNPVQSPGTEVRLALAARPGGANLLGMLTTEVGSDTALFGLVYLDKQGAGTLVASADGLMPATMTLDVVPAAFTRISSGIDGGGVSGVAAAPAPPGGSSTLFATAARLVFTSTNGGVTWAPPGIGGSGVVGVVVDPQRPGVAYAIPDGVPRYLFRKTTDGGMTWRATTIDGVNLQDFTEQPFAIAIDPTNSSILYVATHPEDSITTLRRSADGGMTWTTSSVSAGCQTIIIDRVTTSNLYCTLDRPGLFRSTDSGVTWASDAGLDGPGPFRMFATPGALFVEAGSQLYRSTDHASAWTPLSIMNPGALAFAPSMPQRVYLDQSDSGGSIRVSNDAGASFGAPVASLPFSILQLTVDPQNPDLVYAATGSGVFLSSDAGVSWSPASAGIDTTLITAVVPVSGTPGAWLASTPQSVVRTTNDGATWTQVAQVGEAQLALDPANAANVYACGHQFAASTDGGAHFGAATNSLSCWDLVASENRLFAYNGRLHRSGDRGVSWTDVGFTSGWSPTLVAVGDAAGSVVLVGSYGGLFRSSDDGSTFLPVSGEAVTGLFSDPHDRSHVLVLVAGRGPCELRDSSDGGSTFKTTGSPPVCDAGYQTGGVLYARGYRYSYHYDSHSYDLVLVRSTDGGVNWPAISTAGLPGGSTIISIAVVDGRTTFSATTGDLTINSIAVADDGTTFVGTAGGLYRSSGR